MLTRRKKKVLDDVQKATKAKNAIKVSDAIQAIRDTGEKENTKNLMKETGLSKTTVLNHWRAYRKEDEKRKEEAKESLFSPYLTNPSMLKFIDEMNPTVHEMTKKIENMNIFTFIPRKNLLYERTALIQKLRPFYLRKLSQLERSLKIHTRANQKAWFFEEEFKRKFMNHIIKFFYLFFFRLGFDKNPEKLKCKVTIDFDPLAGTIEFLSDEIDKGELSVFNNTHDFDKTITQLLEDHCAHYRLTALKNRTYIKTDYEEFEKKVLNYSKHRILSKFETEEPDIIAYIPYLHDADGNFEKDATQDAILKWKTRLREMLDHYRSVYKVEPAS